jgi:hypothetical protein
MTLSVMTGGLIPMFKCNNSTFIMFIHANENDDDYFVVNELLNIRC